MLPRGEMSLELLQRQSDDFSLKRHSLPSNHAPHGDLMGMLLGLCCSSDFCLLPSFNKSELFLFRKKLMTCCLSEEGLNPSLPHLLRWWCLWEARHFHGYLFARSKTDLRLSGMMKASNAQIASAWIWLGGHMQSSWQCWGSTSPSSPKSIWIKDVVACTVFISNDIIFWILQQSRFQRNNLKFEYMGVVCTDKRLVRSKEMFHHAAVIQIAC